MAVGQLLFLSVDYPAARRSRESRHGRRVSPRSGWWVVLKEKTGTSGCSGALGGSCFAKPSVSHHLTMLSITVELWPAEIMPSVSRGARGTSVRSLISDSALIKRPDCWR